MPLFIILSPTYSSVDIHIMPQHPITAPSIALGLNSIVSHYFTHDAWLSKIVR